MQVLKTRAFSRFASKNSIHDGKLLDAVKEVESGLIDADLGGGLIQKRIAREGGGKRGGYRTMIAYRRGEKAFFVYGFPKSAMENIDPQDLADLKELARVYSDLDEGEIAKAIRAGVLIEVREDAEKIQK